MIKWKEVDPENDIRAVVSLVSEPSSGMTDFLQETPLMAKYFKYKTTAELVADAQALGGSLKWTDNLSVLFQPVNVGSRTVGNRLCVQPMEGCDGTLDGRPDELTYRRYQRFGAGGAKLIWGEATAISDEGRMNPRQLWLHDGSASAIEQMLEGCRRAHREAGYNTADLLVGLQLTHSGRYSYREPRLVVHCPLLDPLTRNKPLGRMVSASDPLVTDSELQKIEDQYVAATHRAAAIGVDFIDLKQCHRYLLSELLGARHRAGAYGGSLENRTRLIRNIVQRIRSELPGLLIATRLNCYDGVPFRKTEESSTGQPVPLSLPVETAFGVDPWQPARVNLEEPLQLVRWLRDWGVQLMNVTLGNPYANPHFVRPAEFAPVDGYEAPEHPLSGVLRHFEVTAAIQQAVPEIPVVGSGYSWLQDFFPQVGAGNVQVGGCSFVGLGRGALSHPDFAAELATQGKLNRKQVCRTFSYCTNLMRAKDHPLGQYATGCPPFDKEVYGPLWKEVESRRKQER